MNFFESQDRVRQKTMQLVILFALAVISLILMTNFLVMVVFGYFNSEQLQMDWQAFAVVSLGVSVLVVAGSLYKIMTLSAGGKVIAQALGGRLIPQNTQDLKQRTLLNVVEEMAIASGTPAPPIYLLGDEQGINAFAAGFAPRDAVIGVTQGTIDHLSREQLQGVIAHEFSHIFNGDMRLNIRLIGVLNGILVIGLLGYYLLHATSSRRVRSSASGNGAAGVLVLGVGLIAIGYAGTFFGGLIKAAVSRQREYLADACAVQFTRNPDGIAGALKRIGGLGFGSKLESPAAAEVSHAFFAQGVAVYIEGLAATHPPLEKRIRRIDPRWDGRFSYFDISDSPTEPTDQHQSQAPDHQAPHQQVAEKMTPAVVGAIASVASAIEQIGNPQPDTIEHARSLLLELPDSIKQAVREPYGTRTVMFCLALDATTVDRDRQLAYLQTHVDADVYALIQTLLPALDGLDVKFRLPLIDMAIPALKQLSLQQYETFRDTLTALIKMDGRTDLLEWTLHKIVLTHLDEHFFHPAPRAKVLFKIDQLKQEAALILSVLAYAGQQDQVEVEAALALQWQCCK